jgi:nucleoside-diphosphate-sugar epimerase
MITIMGASGFIGRNLTRRLRELNIEYYAPERNESPAGRHLGDVIYCIGVTADFRSRPLETVDAHVCYLMNFLAECDFDSLLYLSTTRLYRHGQRTREEDELKINPSDADDLYNISKALGESLVLSCGKHGRVARISNVYGDDFDSQNFLSSVIRQTLAENRVTIRTAPESEKDYVSIDDVVDGLIAIATRGRHQIYNVASGTNVTNAALVDRLRELTGCSFDFLPGAPQVEFAAIDIGRMRDEFSFNPGQLLDRLGELIDLYKRH